MVNLAYLQRKVKSIDSMLYNNTGYKPEIVTFMDVMQKVLNP